MLDLTYSQQWLTDVSEALLTSSRWFLVWPILRTWRWRRHDLSETSIGFQQTTERYIQQDRTIYTLSCLQTLKLKCYKHFSSFPFMLHVSATPCFLCSNDSSSRSQWTRGLRHKLSSLTLTLKSWVRIPLKAWISVLCAFILCLCCSVCRQRPCDGLIPRPRRPTDYVQDQETEKKGQGPTKGWRAKIIQFNSLLFMCRVNSHKANYRHSTV
jgi:hypothetical protein